MENFPIIFFTILTLLRDVARGEEKILWMNSAQFSEDLAVPAGYERDDRSGNFVNLFVARVKMDGENWIPGKYSPGSRKCFVGANGKELQKPESECEILVFPKGSTSWIYTSAGEEMPLDLINAGSVQINGNNIELHPCRARREGQVLLGRMNTHSNKKFCYTTLSGLEYKHKNFEVLTENFMTKVIMKTASVGPDEDNK